MMHEWVFWGAVLAILSAVGIPLLWAVLRSDRVRAARGAITGDGVPADLAFYRAQHTQLAVDLARGVIAPQEAGLMRLEIERRLLDADRSQSRAEPAHAVPSWAQRTLLGVVVFGLLGAVALYIFQLGAPLYADLPLRARIEAAQAARDMRPGQSAAEADMAVRGAPATDAPPDPAYAALVERLRLAVAANPNDLQGLDLLARNEAGLGNFAAAARSQAQVVALLGGQAGAADHAILADLLILAAGGYVSPEAETALRAALAIDPKNGMARYYAGLMEAQAGRFDLSFVVWRDLLQDSPADAPWMDPLRADLPGVAQRAGVKFTLPEPEFAPQLAGPTAADVAAAQQMSTEDRQAMIATMVAGLSERLTTEGGTPEEWARLIRSYAMLNDRDSAVMAWNDAQAQFAGTADLEQIRAAARAVGVAP